MRRDGHRQLKQIGERLRGLRDVLDIEAQEVADLCGISLEHYLKMESGEGELSVAKGIANGFPMGAVLIAPKFEAVYGQLGTTFGGNHLACAAALAVLDVIEGEGLVENARKVGEHLLSEIKKLKNESIKEVRGRGLMIGIELDVPYKEIRQRLLMDEHVFTGCAGTNVLRLLPPLCLSMAEADEFIEKLKRTLPPPSLLGREQLPCNDNK